MVSTTSSVPQSNGVGKLPAAQMDRLGARPLASSSQGADFSFSKAPNMVSGIDYLRDPKLFKGMAFSLEERQTLGIHGLLPPRTKTQDEMAEHSMRNLRRFDDPLNKYMYMADLLERNEKLFYKVLSENTEELMPIVYTPTVGLACQKFGLAFKRPKVTDSEAFTKKERAKLGTFAKRWPIRSAVPTTIFGDQKCHNESFS